ncbi:MAG: glutamate racemase [Candidatus Acididesulfobacter guangdongensis]|uniref:Glutamate racemase n=1 Tax=Acididesulfobacter guangdongensis TaxID=2597225 RepID=A0A519BEG4_ACIG2|nr:MAG: glutamate racemase [Candidatus Acididesulfobacter guangdongensis]
MSTDNSRPIGIFDSGLGGLTVFKEIRQLLRYENLIYFGDTARVPYGNKSKETILRYSKEITKFLLKNDVKLIVVACNTVSSLALDELKKEFGIPIFGVIEPGARCAYKKLIERSRSENKGTATEKKILSDAAADLSDTATIAVIGTSATIGSKAYSNAINRLNNYNNGEGANINVKIIEKACPLLVPLVEEGWINSDITRDVIKYYLQPVIESNPFSIVLGCTHYPMLKKIISEIADNSTEIIDSGKEVAIEVKNFLLRNKMLNGKADRPYEKYYVSDDPEKFKLLGSNFIGSNITEHIEVVIDFL